MNEWIFVAQTLFLLACTLGAYRLGREAMTVWITLQMLSANFFLLKQVPLFGWEVTSCDAYIVSAMVGNNLLQDRYGKKFARIVVMLSWCALFAFAGCAHFHSLFEGKGESLYSILVQSYTWAVLSSSLISLSMQWLDIQLFGWVKEKYPKLSLGWRVLFSIMFIQLLDTTLFTYIALAGTHHHLTHVIVFSYAIKLIAAGLTIFPILCIKPSKEHACL